MAYPIDKYLCTKNKEQKIRKWINRKKKILWHQLQILSVESETEVLKLEYYLRDLLEYYLRDLDLEVTQKLDFLKVNDLNQ